MNKIVLRDSKNKKIEVDFVRYFKYQNNHYFIYTFGETDDKNFVKLYVVKILEELGSPVAHYIGDGEWQQMQDIVKVLLKQIKSGKHDSFVDLDIAHLINLKVEKARDFKLLDRLVGILSGEIVEEDSISEEHKNELQTPEEVPVSSQEPKNIVINNESSNSEENSVEEPITVKKEETSEPKENIYDIRPVIPVIENKNIEKMEIEPEEIDVIEPIMITPIFEEIEGKTMIKEPIDIALDSIDREIEDISLDDFSDYLISVEDIKEEEQKNDDTMETIIIPNFQPFEPSRHEKKLEDISNQSRMQMLSLENERLKNENQQLKDELREYKSKYQKLRDFIQTEI